MEIQCPACLKRLSIGDQFAGQPVRCPACNGVFNAPALAAAPVVPPPEPPAVVPDILPFSGDAPPRPEAPPYSPLPPKPAARFVPDEEPAGTPGDYSARHTLQLRYDVIQWIAPACLTLLFFLSFLSWIAIADGKTITGSQNLWEASFGEKGQTSYIFYLLVTLFLALPLAWAIQLMSMNLVPTPAALKPFWRWRTFLLAGLLVATALIPLVDLVRFNFTESVNLSLLGMKLGIRVHLLAIIGAGLDVWLQHRKTHRLPPPEATLRW